MTPTGSSPRPIPGLRIPCDLHDANTDLDPTEWKPVISRRNGSSASLASTEAWTYLSQFHGGDEAMLTLRGRRSDGGVHRSSASLSALMQGPGPGPGQGPGVPSLTHTPSTAASSFNSNSDYVSYSYSYMYDFAAATRPLPPRHNPSFSSSAGATKGVELVVPHFVPATPVVAAVTGPMAAAAGQSISVSVSPKGGDGDGVWFPKAAVKKPVIESVLSSVASSSLGGVVDMSKTKTSTVTTTTITAITTTN
jgi:hypothetical protein